MSLARLALCVFAIPLLAVTVAGSASAAISFQSLTNGQNNDANTLVIGRPAGTAVGDFLLAQVTVEKGSDITITPPAGWTLILRTDRGSDIGQGIYWKEATGSEPASYTFGFNQSNKAAGGILRYTGVDTANPIIASTGNTGDANPMRGLSVASEPNSMLVGFWGLKKKDSTMSTPGGMTERYIFQNPNDVRIKAAEQLNPANPTGDKLSIAGNIDKWVAQLVTLRQASGVPAPGSFNAFETSTAAGAISGVIKTKVAGTAFSLDVVAIASGAQFAAFTDAVMVDLLGNNTLGVALDANNCPTSSTAVQTVSPDPTVAGGRSTVNFAAVADSWRDVRVRVRWPSGAPTVTSCSTDNFAIRPNAFANFAVSDTDWQTAGTGRALDDMTFGAVVHKAGRPVSVRAAAVNAAGTPAVTANYAGTPTVTLSACPGVACTPAFGALTLNAAFASGQLVTDVATYDNVGSFRMQLADTDFATVDAADGSTAAERDIVSAAIDVGRFVPDHFTVALNTPELGTACGSFTYQGQRFSYTTAPLITVTARNFAGNPASFYDGSWWRITNASLAPATQAGRYSAAGAIALDLALLPGTNADPAIAASGAGVGTLTFSSGTGIAFSRTAPAAPFDAEIALAVDVIDADAVAYAGNPAKFGDASAGNGIAFDAGKAQRFGRLRLQNAFGPESLALRVGLETQYWNGTGFMLNTLDACTSLNREHVALSGYTQSLNACDTAVIEAAVTVVGGQATLTLAAAGAGNAGTVLLTPVLGALGAERYCPAKGGGDAAAVSADRAYLQGAWSGAAWDDDPSGQAAFGLYGSQPKNFIFFRENY